MKQKSFLECHLTAGGHKGRDATIAKIKQHYYLPNYYKEVKGKVSTVQSSYNFTNSRVAMHFHAWLHAKSYRVPRIIAVCAPYMGVHAWY